MSHQPCLDIASNRLARKHRMGILLTQVPWRLCNLPLQSIRELGR